MLAEEDHMGSAVKMAVSVGMVTMFALTAGVAVARPKVTLSQCAAKWESCTGWCPGYGYSPIPPSSNPLSDKNCLNRCDANHAACVDAAMSRNVRAPNPKPPRPDRGRRLPSEGILEEAGGFGETTVSPAGTPKGTAPGGGGGGSLK